MTVALSRGADRTILLTVTEGNEGQGADLESLAGRCSGDVRVRVEAGKKASEVIRRVIEEEDATLLLVGRKGRGLLRNRLLGSTAENASRDSLVPALVLP
jgi:nucleotide-binding universal stress UspA family protein